VAGPLERADEIGFELSLNLIISLLIFSRQLLVGDWFIPRHPVNSSHGVKEDDEVDEDDEDDEAGDNGPTGRARMCCRSKPTGEQRLATQGTGRLPGLLVGPGPSVNGPKSSHVLASGLLGVPPDLISDQEGVMC
jgi:hypothetical protein